MLLIDAANVVGSRPTGWWRDRARAADQFVARVRAANAASKLGAAVVVVLEGVARQGVEEGVSQGVEVVHAPGHGDDTLVALVEAASHPVVVVSADRALGDRCRALGSDVVGPNWLLDRLTP
ncbi:MAG: NTP pyrophosphohydrolase [Actinomycetota bacterium]|nr:NTP pyrophosphohydrolase [Actinomycetota bacterium]